MDVEVKAPVLAKGCEAFCSFSVSLFSLFFLVFFFLSRLMKSFYNGVTLYCGPFRKCVYNQVESVLGGWRVLGSDRGLVERHRNVQVSAVVLLWSKDQG